MDLSRFSAAPITRLSGLLFECNHHVQCSKRQIAFHQIADGPTNDTLGIQVADDSQIEPTLPCPDIAYVTRPFLVGAVCMEVPVQQVRRDVEAMIVIRARLELLVSLRRNAVQSHQGADGAMFVSVASDPHLGA